MNRTLTKLFLVAVAAAALPPAGTHAVVHEKGYGEPYDVGGKRIVFTTWYWVRPGQLDWQDEKGKSVFANKGVKAGPYDAHFVNIDGPWGVRLTVERAQRAPRFEIKPEKPWEAKGINVTQLLPTPDGKIMAWGTCTDADGNDHACYLESRDGAVTWVRPSLNLVDYKGSKENNLTPGGPSGHVFIDPNGTAEERFKSASNSKWTLEGLAEYKKRRPWQVMATETDPGEVHAIFGYTSPDGITWKQIPTPISVETSDGDQSVYWDANLKKYVMYARTYYVGPRADGYPLKHERRHQFIGRRAMGRSEATDFREFTLSEVVVDTANDMPPTDTFYLNSYTWIPGNPTEHLMFLSRYQQAQDTTAIDVYSSYDGKSWHVIPGSPVLDTNKYGQWDGGCIFAYPHLIERASDGAWVLLYSGYNVPHKYPRGNMKSDWATAVWPQGRMAAIEAKEQGGFTTPAFLAPGGKLLINALTDRVGDVKVEVADFYGKTLPGHSFDDCTLISGDQYRKHVTWKGDETLGVKPGEPVVLRFKMDHAKIYSLDFE